MANVETPPATAAPAKKGVQADKLIAAYIQLRDRKAGLKKKFDEDTDALDDAMEKIENILHAHLNKIGGESLKTAAGTVYKQTVAKEGVEDWDVVLAHIIANQDWSALVKRVSKDWVKAYRDEHSDNPPGVKWDEAVVVNIRR